MQIHNLFSGDTGKAIFFSWIVQKSEVLNHIFPHEVLFTLIEGNSD